MYGAGTWSWIVPDGLWEIAKPLIPPSKVRPQGGGTQVTPVQATRPPHHIGEPALVEAGVIAPPETKEDRHAAAREHGMHALRHFYASALLDAGENIKAVSEYLGHSNAALTLRIYAHLMPSSQVRTRSAIASVYETARPEA